MAGKRVGVTAMERLIELSARAEAETATVFCWAVAVSFLISAWTKLRNLEAFRLICAGYPGAVRIGVRTVASFVLMTEIAAGLAILTPHRWGLFFGLALALGCSVVASGAVALRRLRGEKRFRCGCGMDLSEESNANGLLVRNAFIIGGLVVILVRGNAQLPTFDQAIPLVLTALSLVLVFHLLGAAARTWWRIGEWNRGG